MSEASAKAFITDPAGSTSAQDVRDAIGTIYTDLTNVGNMWKMSKSSSQTLTNSTPTPITFDRADIDGEGSVINLASDRFDAPATGFYMAFVTWLWEASAPAVSSFVEVLVGGASVSPIARTDSGGSTNSGLSANFPLSLTAADAVTLTINPSTATGVTARGNASVHLSTALTLVRIT